MHIILLISGERNVFLNMYNIFHSILGKLTKKCSDYCDASEVTKVEKLMVQYVALVKLLLWLIFQKTRVLFYTHLGFQTSA